MVESNQFQRRSDSSCEQKLKLLNDEIAQLQSSLTELQAQKERLYNEQLQKEQHEAQQESVKQQQKVYHSSLTSFDIPSAGSRPGTLSSTSKSGASRSGGNSTLPFHQPILEELKVEDDLQLAILPTQPSTQPQQNDQELEQRIQLAVQVVQVFLRDGIPLHRILGGLASCEGIPLNSMMASLDITPPQPRVTTINNFSQTEEHKISNSGLLAENGNNPEENENSSSFSNPLPSSHNSSDERSRVIQRNPKEQNRFRTVQQTNNNEQEILYELSRDKKVKIGVWREKNLLLVHIREYYQGRNRRGEIVEEPGKKGIALTVQQWRRLVDNINDMDEDVAETQDHQMGNSSFISEQNSFAAHLQQPQSYGANRLQGRQQDESSTMIYRHSQLSAGSSLRGSGYQSYSRGGGGNRYH